MAEELALEQFTRDRGAINAHQSGVLARAAVVDGARDEFLAGARFAQDKNAGVGRRDHFDLREHFLERGAVAEDGAVVGAQFLLQILVLELQRFAILDAR